MDFWAKCCSARFLVTNFGPGMLMLDPLFVRSFLFWFFAFSIFVIRIDLFGLIHPAFHSHTYTPQCEPTRLVERQPCHASYGAAEKGVYHKNKMQCPTTLCLCRFARSITPSCPCAKLAGNSCWLLGTRSRHQKLLIIAIWLTIWMVKNF